MRSWFDRLPPEADSPEANLGAFRTMSETRGDFGKTLIERSVGVDIGCIGNYDNENRNH